MPAGRPPLFKTADELEQHGKAYFDFDTDNKPTITGLALYLGFESRQSFYDYEKDGEFSYIVKRLRLKIESVYEKALHGTTPTGAIFALKNFGWKDKQEVEQSGGVTIRYENPGDYIYPTQDQGDSGIPESL